MNRKLEVLREENWVETTMKELKCGEKFRMFEPEGEPVIFKDSSIFVVGKNPVQKKGVWSIEIIDPTDKYVKEILQDGKL